MTKIIIISCIVAVCVLQTATAGIFDGLLPKTPLNQDRLGNFIPNPLDQGKEVKDKIENQAKEIKDKIENQAKETLDLFGNAKDTLSSYVKELLTDVPNKFKNVTDGIKTALQSPACTDLSTLVENTYNEAKSSFISCAVNVTQSTNIQQTIEDITNATNNLISTVSKVFTNFSDCTKNSDLLVNCFYQLPQDLSTIPPSFKDVVTKADTLRSTLPNFGANLGACYSQAISSALSQNNSSDIIQNGHECALIVAQNTEKDIRDIIQYARDNIQYIQRVIRLLLGN